MSNHDGQNDGAGQPPGGEDPRPDPGLYVVGENGAFIRLAPGSYWVDTGGRVQNTSAFNDAMGKIDWEKMPELVVGYLSRGQKERKLSLIMRYGVAALIVLIAGTLAFFDVIDGHAMSAFMGAAIGYVLSRATEGKS